jgi:hypothetical protein
MFGASMEAVRSGSIHMAALMPEVEDDETLLQMRSIDGAILQACLSSFSNVSFLNLIFLVH